MGNRHFEGKAVLISGAGRGFGRLAAERFAAEGAKLVLTDILETELAETVAAVKGLGTETEALTGDIAEEAMAKRLVSASVSRFGRLDIAINNAGVVHPPRKLPLIDAETFERVIRIDLGGVFYAMKHQIPQMEMQGGGVILNVSSVAGIGGAPLLSAYAAAKHGVIGLTKSAAIEYAQKNIRINAICPAFARTAMLKESLEHMRGSPDEALTRLIGTLPMQRPGTPGEIVQAMLWMCSPENSFMTGHALAIDGGLTAM